MRRAKKYNNQENKYSRNQLDNKKRRNKKIKKGVVATGGVLAGVVAVSSILADVSTGISANKSYKHVNDMKNADRYY